MKRRRPGLAISESGVLIIGLVKIKWDRLVPPDLLGSDGVHPTTGQEGLLASFLDPFLLTWREAVAGRGPTGCQSDVEIEIGG